jgi:hypothetical protein
MSRFPAVNDEQAAPPPQPSWTRMVRGRRGHEHRDIQHRGLAQACRDVDQLRPPTLSQNLGDQGLLPRERVMPVDCLVERTEVRRRQGAAVRVGR